MHIFQINVSQGGVPKRSCAVAEITAEGVEGDRQNNRDVHGGPDRAVCLYSLERILALQAEGHPIYPGAIGENLTLTGLDWDALQPGMSLRLGERLMLEITRFTTPCNTIRGAFSGDQYGRVSQSNHPGWSRVYARVLVPGQVRPGDTVVMLD
jgi:MOSC domain-containing protein YiiM